MKNYDAAKIQEFSRNKRNLGDESTLSQNKLLPAAFNMREIYISGKDNAVNLMRALFDFGIFSHITVSYNELDGGLLRLTLFPIEM